MFKHGHLDFPFSFDICIIVLFLQALEHISKNFVSNIIYFLIFLNVFSFHFVIFLLFSSLFLVFS